MIFSQRTKSVIRRTVAVGGHRRDRRRQFRRRDRVRRLAQRRPLLVPPPLRSDRAGREGELARLGDERSRGVPDRTLLVEQAVLDEARHERHRSGPGAGTPRTCTVSSTVGTHATGSSVLNTAGGNASAASRSAIASIGSSSANANQPVDPRLTGRLAGAEPDVAPVAGGSAAARTSPASALRSGGGGTAQSSYDGRSTGASRV